VICENCKEGQYNMDKDRIAGSAKQAKRAVKEVAGISNGAFAAQRAR
jgi:hypothetical protein